MSLPLPNQHPMNAKTTVLLLVVLLAVGGYVFFFELDNLTTRERERLPGASEPETAALLDPETFTLDAIEEVRIARNGESMTFALQEDETAGTGWWQTQPARFPLRRTPTEDLIRAAVDLRVHQRITPGTDDLPGPAALGFAGATPRGEEPDSDPPRTATRVTLKTRDGPFRTIELGKRSMQQRAYVRFADESGVVYVVGDALHREAVGASPADFRLRRTEPQGFTVPRQADRVTVEHGGETIDVHRIDGRWFLSEQATERADADAVDALARAAGDLRIEDFFTDDPDSLATYGLAPPSLRIRIEADLPAPPPDADDVAADDEDDPDSEADPQADPDAATAATADAAWSSGITRTHEIRIGGPADLDRAQRFARWSIDGEASSVLFTVRDDALQTLRVGVDELRDPAVVLTEPGAVSELRLERGLGGEEVEVIRLVRDSGAWRFAAQTAVDFAPDREAVEGWLSSITDMSSTSFAPPPAGQPAMRLRLYAGGETEEIRLHKSGDALLAVRNNETIAYRLNDADRASLETTPLALRRRTLLRLTPEALREIRLTQPDGAELTFRKQAVEGPVDEDPAAASAWQLRGHDGFETAAFETLLQRVTPLSAERWLERSLALADAGTIELTLVPRDGSARTLRIDPETRRATADFVDTAFVLPQSLIDAATAELRDRTVLALSADRIASIEVDRMGAQPFTIRRSDDGFTSDAGEVDDRAAAALIDRLAGLRVQRHVTGEAGQRDLSTLGIRTTDGGFHEVMLAEPFEQTRTLHVDDRGWYRVSQAVVKDLTAPLRRGSAADE